MKKKLFLIQPYNQHSNRVYSWIADAAAFLDLEVFRADQVAPVGHNISQAVDRLILEADIIICDLSGRNPNVLYELGIAHSQDKVVLLISDTLESVPFDLRAANIYVYDRQGSDQEAIRDIRMYIINALQKPEKLRGRPKSLPAITKVFISYSHKDDSYLKRLLVHLRPLEKAGKIDLWVDTQIKVGEKWKQVIESALSNARTAIMLISADFLASDFIIDNELPPLLKKAETDGTKIIPVILAPCRFTRDPNLKHFQAVNDPAQPISELSYHQREVIYDRVSQIVEDFMLNK